MLKTIKSLSLITKLLYLFAFILFVGWVLPKISSYYTNLNNYQVSVQELKTISTKYGLSTKTQRFSETSFKKMVELLFSKVKITNLGKKLYEMHISIKKEDLKSFHTFIKTLTLRYYVEIEGSLAFKKEDELINVEMTLKAF